MGDFENTVQNRKIRNNSKIPQLTLLLKIKSLLQTSFVLIEANWLPKL